MEHPDTHTHTHTSRTYPNPVFQLEMLQQSRSSCKFEFIKVSNIQRRTWRENSYRFINSNILKLTGVIVIIPQQIREAFQLKKSCWGAKKCIQSSFFNDF